jgi:hypothetical protein
MTHLIPPPRAHAVRMTSVKIPRFWLLAPGLAAAGLFLLLSFAKAPPAGPQRIALMDDEGTPEAREFSEEDYRRHLAGLRKKLPGDGFTIIREKPFVVIGDEPAYRVEHRAKQTVKWASDKLKAAYFASDPKHILDVWLFKDKASYEKHAKKIFGSLPDTKYGYYSAHDRALVMNIATGGGTLVHEMVHAFMDTNFDDCPPWFNEGLGSLYEQCREHDGKIEGLLNWRLPIIQKAIRAGSVPRIEALTRMNTALFYGPGRGTNYAMARYLLYRLQKEGLLRSYYREFLKNRAEDPTGYKTLVEVLDEEDMVAWQKAWEKWVLDLKR